jgi:hypothetical protein
VSLHASSGPPQPSVTYNTLEKFVASATVAMPYLDVRGAVNATDTSGATAP